MQPPIMNEFVTKTHYVYACKIDGVRNLAYQLAAYIGEEAEPCKYDGAIWGISLWREGVNLKEIAKAGDWVVHDGIRVLIFSDSEFHARFMRAHKAEPKVSL